MESPFPTIRRIVQTAAARVTVPDTARILALLLILVFLTALIAIAFAVALSSPGPALISRVYRRKDGRMVDLWEFRTECWRRWQTTQLGHYLRRSNMHRLPSLINVMRGDIAMGERVQSAADW